MDGITAKHTFDGNDPLWPEKLKAALTEEFSGMEAADRKRSKRPPMKETPEDRAVADRTYDIAAGELRQFIEQWEQLDRERAEAVESQKEVMGEAKARGYSISAIKKIIAIRAKDKDAYAEEQALVQMYGAALGMAV